MPTFIIKELCYCYCVIAKLACIMISILITWVTLPGDTYQVASGVFDVIQRRPVPMATDPMDNKVAIRRPGNKKGVFDAQLFTFTVYLFKALPNKHIIYFCIISHDPIHSAAS